MIFEVIEKYKMDPWDIDISLLANNYLQMMREVKQMDFFIGGKVLIAAAFLLRLKSVKLVDEDLTEFDRLLAESHMQDDDFMADFYGELEREWGSGTGPLDRQAAYPLLPRTPQPRKRKVSIYDLVEALQKALEVHDRKVLRDMAAPKVKLPERTRDISQIIKEIFERIKGFFLRNKSNKLTLQQLIPSNSKEDIIQTFVPLLHLSHVSHRKIDLVQEEPFGEIEIKLT